MGGGRGVLFLMDKQCLILNTKDFGEKKKKERKRELCSFPTGFPLSSLIYRATESHFSTG